MSELIVVSPDDAYERAKSGRALLVCAYDDEVRYTKFRLEGSIPLQELEAKLPELPKDHEIIFYCA